MFEINDAAKLVQDSVHPEANSIFGTVIDDTLGDEVRVTVIAAGFDGGEPTHREFPNPRLGALEPETEAISNDTASVMNGFSFSGGQTAGFGTAPIEVDPFAAVPSPATYASIPIDTTYSDDDSDLDVPEFMKNQ